MTNDQEALLRRAVTRADPRNDRTSFISVGKIAEEVGALAAIVLELAILPIDIIPSTGDRAPPRPDALYAKLIDFVEDSPALTRIGTAARGVFARDLVLGMLDILDEGPIPEPKLVDGCLVGREFVDGQFKQAVKAIRRGE